LSGISFLLPEIEGVALYLLTLRYFIVGGVQMAAVESNIAKTVFYIAAVVGVIYGVLFLLMPNFMFQLSQDPGVPPNPGWVRWSGGFLIGIATAVFLAADKPERQRALALGLAIGYSLIALALLYSTLSGEYRGAQWFIWGPIVINVILAAAMAWVSRKR